MIWLRRFSFRPFRGSTETARPRFGFVDIMLILMVVALFYGFARHGEGGNPPAGGAVSTPVSLSPALLPYYAARSLLRMFIALALSVAVSLAYGYTAAFRRGADRILIPLLDILQSVPVLGFLSVFLTGLMRLFPNSLAGAEIASILAIFTGQVWNMAFGFYQSLRTIPPDLHEAARVMRLGTWGRFINLELPSAMISLVWNGMMSFGGGWFFLAASEAITVLGRDIRLPGIGSYMATAMDRKNLTALVWAIVAMVVLIVAVDQLFWRPVVAWAQKFKMTQTTDEDVPTFNSAVLTLLRRSPVATWLLDRLAPRRERIYRRLAGASSGARAYETSRGFHYLTTGLKWGILAFVAVWLIRYAVTGVELLAQAGPGLVPNVLTLGLWTLLRVTAAVLLGAAWTVPVGVAIGFRPRLARLLQPLVQIAASFPANLLFPLVAILYLRYNINFQIGSIPLMMLGTQWYILFNVIAAASALPGDLRETAAVFRLRGWDRWRKMILPGIFQGLVTGMVTAAGGAWNASIIAEIVTWGGSRLEAAGLGAFITNATRNGDTAGIIWGILVMIIYVVTVNRLLWRRLYALAETKYHIG